MRQDQWRAYIARKYDRYPPQDIRPRESVATRTTEEATMARTIKLPARSNAVQYDPSEVADILATLLTTPKGEAVIVDEAQDTEPKARVRCRTMAKLVTEGVTIEDAADVLDADLLTALAEEDIEPDEDGTLSLDGLATRTHVIAEGDEYLPVLSVKNA